MQPTQPVGRGLRILFGLALILYVAPVYFRLPIRITVELLLLTVGLIGIYSLINVAIAGRIVTIGPILGAVVTTGLLVAIYFAGASKFPIVGHGKGQLAAITFLGASLVIAGIRALPGCEVMAIPSLLLGRHADLPCLIFSPLDRLESKCQRKPNV